MGNPCCAREHSVQFWVQFYTVILHNLTYSVWGPLHIKKVDTTRIACLCATQDDFVCMVCLWDPICLQNNSHSSLKHY